MNAVTHGVGFLAAAIVAPLAIVWIAAEARIGIVVGAGVFAGTAAVLYLASALYHALPAGPAKRFFRQVDYAAIYTLIAGSYTPFAIGVLGGALGWTLLGVVWTLALAGMLTKVLGFLRCPKLTTGLYVALGWLVLAVLRQLWSAMSPEAFGWLVAGGLAYTVGVVFFVGDRKPWFHAIWHVFVLAGTVCHFTAVLLSR